MTDDIKFLLQILVFTTNTVYVPSPNTLAVEIVVRAGGGSGQSGTSHSTTNQRRCGAGGGGGAAVTLGRRISVDDIPSAGLPIIVAAGGARTAAPSAANGARVDGNDGAASSFGDVVAQGGRGGGYAFGATAPVQGVRGAPGGAAGYDRGGAGGGDGTDGETVTSFPIRMLSGGGGGGSGDGYNAAGTLCNGTWGKGGGSGFVPGGALGSPGVSNPTFWPLLQSGSGGGGGLYASSTAGGTGGFPSGGGGGGSGQATGTRGGAGANGCVTVIEYIKDV